MKKIFDITAYLSLFLNIAYISLWIFLGSSYTDFDIAKERFLKYMPFPHGITVILLIILSIFSLIVLARKETAFPKVLAVIQSLFVFIYVWQYL